MSNRKRQYYAVPPALKMRSVNGTAVNSGVSASLPMNKAKSQVFSVCIERTANGQWEVRDETGLKGGLFRDYRSALRFVKDEFLMQQLSLVSLTGGKRKG